ncbi:hypothetical protein SE17_25870 [Kouleothrix aurantiaca]|uniref:Uncharacterized protein n=1 Tax=Kouleothrix aurantiaca TaxID=186479 RepID=A0A0N8PRR0_9CHLR|nr:hypothetical protein SE17_25870 [Kouleothrix aurantiaca]
MKSFKPVDFVVRGAFVAAVVAGGLADMAHSAPATQASFATPRASAATSCHLNRHDTHRAELGMFASSGRIAQAGCTTL